MTTLNRRLFAVFATLGLMVALVAGLASSASAYPGNTGGVTVTNNNPPEGGSVTLNGTSCAPNSTVTFTLDTGADLGTAPTDANGTYSKTVQLPDGVTGKHDITVSGAQCSAVAALTIQAAGGNGGGGGLAGTGVAVLGLGALGVVLLVGGGLMLLAGRRRKIAA